MKKIICLFLSVFSFGTAFANWTVIDSNAPVQCNDWGWVYGNARTVWTNSCSPLSVNTARGILTVDTNNVCGEEEAAWYVHRYNNLELIACVPVAKFAK